MFVNISSKVEVYSRRKGLLDKMSSEVEGYSRGRGLLVKISSGVEGYSREGAYSREGGLFEGWDLIEDLRYRKMYHLHE